MSVFPSSVACGQSAGAAVVLAIKRFSGEPSTSVLDTNSPGVTVSAGAPVTPKIGVEFEVGIDRSATVTRTTDIRQGRLRTEYVNQMWTMSVLGAVHPLVRQRVRASVLGGLTFVSFRRSVRQNPAAPVIGTVDQPPDSVFVDRVGGATVGGDLAFALSPHVWIVPAVRLHTFRLASEMSGFCIRPSAGLKWTF
jgi:hypothetical protein